MNTRIVISSGRPVLTIEEEDCFWVFRRTTTIGTSVSGPFPLNDPRFTEKIK